MMEWTAWMGVALGVVMASSPRIGAPPVILDLGPVVATPAPTPKAAERKRLVTTITVQNAPDGESLVTFEVTDFADEGKGKTRTIAAKSYSLSDRKPELKEMAEEITEQLRHLERKMLEFAEKAGPPKERAPVVPGGSGSRP